ncbi:MAG: bifunctional adenosylcobinamide kinase/adenosylcobinamide-phosphate guanylyltransferase [Proteobacteria bacterium]|nr:bifunctional adenosylcobinamide kinase/adenosylcobinamide-phosphate guanylyltransferase [Pseudomonadota bacterium]MBU1059513.1 bifunctional adenosylcobinamide kinase/adenosylcobinamide-phosphate guanylyltransferase [Pseudomonadota bacterium]
MGRLILVTGGARSGKSDYALTRAQALSGPHFFLATCPVIDSEMDDRIARHKADRKNGRWQTIEEELELAATISSLESPSVCLIDCLTLWVNNLLYLAEKTNMCFGEPEIQARAEALIHAADNYRGTLICVSNEVGMGIVPDNAAARVYRDLVGRCNRILAEAANEVILVSCGLPLFLKKSADE